MSKPDEDKELAKLLTGYQDMIGLLNVHKVARFNTQVHSFLFFILNHYINRHALNALFFLLLCGTANNLHTGRV